MKLKQFAMIDYTKYYQPDLYQEYLLLSSYITHTLQGKRHLPSDVMKHTSLYFTEISNIDVSFFDTQLLNGDVIYYNKEWYSIAFQFNYNLGHGLDEHDTPFYFINSLTHNHMPQTRIYDKTHIRSFLKDKTFTILRPINRTNIDEGQIQNDWDDPTSTVDYPSIDLVNKRFMKIEAWNNITSSVHLDLMDYPYIVGVPSEHPYFTSDDVTNRYKNYLAHSLTIDINSIEYKEIMEQTSDNYGPTYLEEIRTPRIGDRILVNLFNSIQLDEVLITRAPSPMYGEGIENFYNNFVGKYVDKYGNTASSVDNTGANNYAGQCASLALAFLRLVVGRTAESYGNAVDYVNLPNSTTVTTPRDGDIIVWPNISPPYGHVGIYYNGQVFNQNPYTAKLSPITLATPYIIKRPNDYNGTTSNVEPEVIAKLPAVWEFADTTTEWVITAITNNGIQIKLSEDSLANKHAFSNIFNLSNMYHYQNDEINKTLLNIDGSITNISNEVTRLGDQIININNTLNEYNTRLENIENFITQITNIIGDSNSFGDILTWIKYSWDNSANGTYKLAWGNHNERTNDGYFIRTRPDNIAGDVVFG